MCSQRSVQLCLKYSDDLLNIQHEVFLAIFTLQKLDEDAYFYLKHLRHTLASFVNQKKHQ